ERGVYQKPFKKRFLMLWLRLSKSRIERAGFDGKRSFTIRKSISRLTNPMFIFAFGCWRGKPKRNGNVKLMHFLMLLDVTWLLQKSNVEWFRLRSSMETCLLLQPPIRKMRNIRFRSDMARVVGWNGTSTNFLTRSSWG